MAIEIKIVTAIFNPDSATANAYGLWQWDYGQVLRIQGLHLPSMVEIHFSLQDTGGTSVMRVGITKDGVTDVVIPDSMLQNNGAASDYDIFAFVYLTDDTSGQTEYKIKLRVKSRPEPEVPSGGEDPNIFREAVQAVKKSADKASESERQAEGWAHGREDLPERAEDNAKYYAGQTAADAKKTGTDRKEVERLAESVSDIDQQVTKVENLTKQAQTSTTNAALSEQAAKTAETNAQNAQAGAEIAEGNAELAEQGAKASKQAAEKAKQLVTQMGQEVLNNKNHVDQTVQAFTLTAQQAVADVNKAGQTQTERVQSVGNTAVESVKTAQNTATKAVEEAKAEAIEAVQTEGTTQTGNVTAEGTKQVQAVQAAAQEIVADREQIAQNKADIAEIKEEMDNLSPAIVDTATGESIVVEDSSGNKFRGLSIYGKSEQLQTTGAQLFDFENAMQKKIGNWISTNILSAQNTNDISVDWKYLKGTAQGYIAIVSPFEFEAKKTVYLNINKVNAQRLLVYDTTGVTKHDLSTNSYTPTESFSGYIGIGIDKGRDVNGALICGYTSDFSATEPYTGGKPSPSVEYPQEIANAGDKGNIGVDVYGGNLFDIDAEPFEGRRNDYIFENNAIYKDNIIPYKAIRYYIKVPPKTRLRLSVDVISNSTTVQVSNYKEGGTTVNASIRKSNRETIFDTNEHEKLVVSIYNFKEGMLKAGNIMVGIAGEAKNIFEPYKPAQILALATPNGLPGIKVDSGGNYTDETGQQWVCDEIDLERGKYVQRIYSCRKEDYSIVKWSNGEYFVICYEVPTPSVKEKAVCSATNILRSSWINGAKPYYFLQTKGQKVIIALGVDYCFSETEMRKILDRGIEFIYVLESPIEHDLPPEVVEAYKKLHTNYPVTTVLNDAGAGMKVEYVADTKHYIDKKFEELNAKVVNTQIALL